ncbi:helix-turn-helix domain-containing protein [Aquipuribacter sp. SD81]|uniref:helix-turn-helix domain-containing protein n=1 Tax=Aquipuribacter sp. SD81 TaxID=3127703 RepID=UPI00301B04A5
MSEVETRPAGPGRAPGPDDVVLEDAAAIRALAHPARLLAVELLFARAGRTMTATELAAQAGITPSAMSYHLRSLARHGLVRRADPDGDERERPWSAAGAQVVVRSPSGAGTQARAALDLLVGGMLDRLAASLHALSARADHDDPAWRVGGLSPATLQLTAEEAADLHTELHALVGRYADRHPPGAPGTRAVDVVLALVPGPAAEGTDRPV